MSRGFKALKVREWTERLGRFDESGKTVAKFCRSEDVSAPSFYMWKKRLADPTVTERPKADRKREPSIRLKRPSSQNGAFESVELLGPASGATIVRLPDGTEIQLGSDLRTAEVLFQQLLSRSSNSASSPSC